MTKMTYQQQMHSLMVIHDAINYLILNPEHQTSGALARNAWGKSVSPTDPTACQWCALGRIAHDFEFDTKNNRDAERDFIVTHLYPLGYNAGFFVRHNDVRGDMDRTASLKELLRYISNHPTLLTGRVN